MKTYEQITDETAVKRFLLVGDAMEAFADIAGVHDINLKRCGNMLDAINIAAHGEFDCILIVLSSFGVRLESSLTTLRRISSPAKILLLAKMHEEPAARTLMLSANADDYFICPVHTTDLPGIRNNGSLTLKSADKIQNDYKDARIKELEKLAMQDDLTGLKNRRYIREFLTQIINRAKVDNLCVTLLVFDIDNFKHYNDTYGHATGDSVLKQAATMMRRCCRDHDVVGRIGGDEFAVVFWDRPSNSNRSGKETETERRQTKNPNHPNEAFIIAERFRKEISSTEHSFLGPEGKGELTISGGLASFPRDGVTVEGLFEQADNAMLNAKNSGKNRVYLVGKPGQQ